MAQILLTLPVHKFSIESNIAHNLSLLEKCSNMEDIKQIHAQMCKTGIVKDVISSGKLLSCYALSGLGNLTYAQRFFERISSPNTVMWNTMIEGYSNSNEPEEALALYLQMLFGSIPHNSYTFPFLLKACSKFCNFEETRQLHGHVKKFGFGIETYAINALLHVYVKCDRIDSARQLFDELHEKDIVSWNSMIDGYAKHNNMKMAFELFKKMRVKNIITWSTMISGCVEAGLSKDALSLFHEVQVSGIKPDNVVLASALSACTELGALDQGKWIHAYIEKNKVQIDPTLSCVLINMYAKCGVLETAEKIFEKTKRKNVSVWTAMINGFAIHGRGREALDLFSQTQNRDVKPNSVTITALLMACNYGGLVEEGKSLFESMEREYGLKPTIEHYGCMTDLLGRAGLLGEAMELIDTVPLKQNVAILGGLLKACRVHGDTELGKRVAKILVNMEPNHGGTYVHLANAHAETKEWDRAVELRRKMKEEGLVKLPGCSVICVNGSVQEFLAGDRLHLL